MQSITAHHSHSKYSPNQQVALVTFQVQETFEFAEWQFVMIEVELQGKKIKKPYSIASTNHHMQEAKQISFVVKKASEDGMSHYLTQTIQEGDHVILKWPVWHYTDSSTHKNYLLISTGSWLSPNVWLFQHLVYESWVHQNIVNIFWEKTHADIVPELEELFTNHGQEHITNFFHLSRQSKPFPPVKGGEGGLFYAPWHVQDSLEQAVEILWTQTSCFVCGAPAMVEEVRQQLEALGIQSEDITFEKY